MAWSGGFQLSHFKNFKMGFLTLFSVSSLLLPVRVISLRLQLSVVRKKDCQQHLKLDLDLFKKQQGILRAFVLGILILQGDSDSASL